MWGGYRGMPRGRGMRGAPQLRGISRGGLGRGGFANPPHMMPPTVQRVPPQLF